MLESDRLYLERRAVEELERAQYGACPEAVRAHYRLLGFYLNRLYPSDAPIGKAPPPAIVISAESE